MRQFARGIQNYYAGKELGQPGWYKINNWVKRAIIADPGAHYHVFRKRTTAGRNWRIDEKQRVRACVRMFTNFDRAYDAYLPLPKHNRNRIAILSSSVERGDKL